MKNVSEKNVVQKVVLFEIMRKNMVEPDRSQMITKCGAERCDLHAR
jgi:hypothetical protein